MKGRGREGGGACLRSHHKVEGPFHCPQIEKQDERRREGTRKWHSCVTAQHDGPGVLYVTLLGLPKVWLLKQVMGPQACLSISPG